MEMNVDKKGAIIIENIKTTMAVENHFLTTSDLDMLTKCYNKELMPEDALKQIKDDIMFRVVK